MNIQMVDLRRQVAELRDELNAAISAVLESGAFVRGPFVKQFEENLSSLYGGAHTLGVGNGTDALQLAYMAAGIGPDDEVIVPAFTIFATAEAAAILGARPVFVDIVPSTFNMDPMLVEAAITEKTKAIVPVHLYGQSADMDPILELAKKYDLAVIEDAAQAIGGRYKGRVLGTLGDVGCLSFYPTKNLGAYGDGGACITTDETLASSLRRLANHGADRKYFNTELGVNSRLDALQAAILFVKLPHLPAWTAARKRAADLYDDALKDIESVETPTRAEYADHVFHQYTVRVPAAMRDDLAAHLKAYGIPTMIYYPFPLHLLPVFESLGYELGAFPESERASNEVLSLPIHPHLADGEIQYVGNAISEFMLEPVPATS